MKISKFVRMSTILVIYDGSVQIISFNRPNKLNAISFQVFMCKTESE